MDDGDREPQAVRPQGAGAPSQPCNLHQGAPATWHAKCAVRPGPCCRFEVNDCSRPTGQTTPIPFVALGRSVQTRIRGNHRVRRLRICEKNWRVESGTVRVCRCSSRPNVEVTKLQNKRGCLCSNTAQDAVHSQHSL